MTNETARIENDAAWWNEIGQLLGWKLHGFTFRLHASFFVPDQHSLASLSGTEAQAIRAALEAARAEGRQALAELADACEGLTPFVRLGEGPLGDDPAANAMRRAFDALGAARAILHDTEAPEGGES